MRCLRKDSLSQTSEEISQPGGVDEKQETQIVLNGGFSAKMHGIASVVNNRSEVLNRMIVH